MYDILYDKSSPWIILHIISGSDWPVLWLRTSLTTTDDLRRTGLCATERRDVTLRQKKRIKLHGKCDLTYLSVAMHLARSDVNILIATGHLLEYIQEQTFRTCECFWRDTF
jgi:hypothetical protein